MANTSLQIGNSNWAIKEDNLLGYSTEGKILLPQPITMTRASAGTRVNSSGLIETVELLGSDLVVNGSFATDLSGWSNKSSTSTWVLGSAIIDNSIGNANSGIFQNIGLVNGKTYTLTATLKLISADQNGNFVVLTSDSGGGSQTIIYTGDTLVIGGSSITKTIEFTIANSDVSIQFACNATNAVFEIDNVSVKESTKNNLARVDYDGTASSLLVEPERTNLIQYSEDFSNAAWVTLGTITVTPNDGTSPLGGMSADKVLGLDSISAISLIVSGTIGTEYTSSVYIKNVDSIMSSLLIRNTTTVVSCGLNWSGNILTSVTNNTGVTTFTNEGGGWYRLKSTYIAIESPQRTRYYPTKTSISSSIMLWGAQLEAGSYATSYIPTDGDTVTRLQDQYEKTGISDLINSEEGVLFVEMAALSDSGTDRKITLSDGNVSNQVIIGFSRFASNINAEIYSGGVLQTSGWGGTGVTQTNNNKFAISWGSGTMKFYINGSPMSPQTGITSPIGLNSLKFSLGNNTLNMFGKVKQLQVFKTALTDKELQTLTT